MRITLFCCVTFLAELVLFTSIAHSEREHSASAGLRWQMTDDIGWSALYERLGIKGTLQDQAQISFIEMRDGEFLDDSVLEVFVSQEGMIHAQRLDAKSNRTCFYIGHIQNVPTIFDRGISLKSEITGTYTCESDSKRGEWKGSVFW